MGLRVYDSESDELVTFRLDKLFEEIEREPRRYPVRNVEPRVQMDGYKWHLIFQRDGGVCWICGEFQVKGQHEVDHLVPRSSFLVEGLALADRSDNLRVSCVPCNRAKSNFDKPVAPYTNGIVAACWECLNGPRFDVDEFPEEAAEYWHGRPWPVMAVAAYCARCGNTHVPDESWLM